MVASSSSETAFIYPYYALFKVTVRARGDNEPSPQNTDEPSSYFAETSKYV